MNRVALALALLALNAAGCTTFDPVARNVCGNGVVEAGEDCDSREATCVACAVVCTAATDCPTSAYTCGADDRCHAPGGTLGQAQVAGPFAADDYRITDIDRDGIGDVVGASRSSIIIRHGASSGLLAVSESQLTPTQTGPAAFGDLDGDASIDLALSTPDGLVAYTSPYGALSPLDVESLLADPTQTTTLDVHYVFSVTREVVGALIVDTVPGSPTIGKLRFLLFDFVDIANPVNILPCDLALTPDQLAATDVETYQINAEGASPTDLVFAMRTGTGADKKLCVLAIHKNSFAETAIVTNITPPNAPTYKQNPVFANISLDPTSRCPSLIDVDGGPAALRRYDAIMTGSGSNTHCVMKPASVIGAQALGGDPLQPLAGPTSQTVIIGHVPTVPALPNCSNDILVTSDGLYLFVAGTTSWLNIYQSARTWSQVAYGDFDLDGRTDLVLAGRGADDLDILSRQSYLGYPVFELFRLDTAAEVTALTIDDYDGNGYPDIGFTELVGDHTELDVSYVTSDRPQPPVPVAVFSQLIASAKVGLTDSADPLDVVADLLVLTPGQPYAGLTFLHGSAQRAMLPYYDPRSDAVGTKYSESTLFRSAVIGKFVPSVGSTSDHPDLVGLAVPKANTAGIGPRAWIAAGNGSTLDGTTSDGSALIGVGAIEASALLAWPVSATHDVVFAIDKSATPAGLVFDPSVQGAPSITAEPTPGFGPIAPGSSERSLHPADLDGDGVPELVAAFAAGSAGLGSVLVCAVDPHGQPHACVDVVATSIAAIAPAGSACFDAAPGHFAYSDRFATPSVASELVVACHEGTGTTLYRVAATTSGYSADVLLHTPAVLGSIQVGDVTGDGVDDVVALTGTRGTEALVVFAQCSSRDASRCAGVSR